MVNTMSAFSSALTILFLFWTITLLGRKLLVKAEEGYTVNQADHAFRKRLCRGNGLHFFGFFLVLRC